MYIPAGMTEAEVTAALLKAADGVAALYTFGFHELEDAKQQAIADAIEKSLPKFDPTRGELVGFLATAMRHSLSNYKRKHYWRNEPPCRACADGRPDAHADGKPCAKHAEWIRRNTAKANLVHPLHIENLEDEPSLPDVAAEAAERNETDELIDAMLPADLREWYLRMKSNLPVPKNHKQAVLAALREILS